MDFGKFGGFENLATLASLGGIGKGSSNFLIWLLIAVIVFGFGKGRSVIENAFVQFGKVPENMNHSRSRRRYHGAVPATAIPIMGFGSFGRRPLNGFLGGNGLFIIVVIALLFLCKDKTDDAVNDSYIGSDEASVE